MNIQIAPPPPGDSFHGIRAPLSEARHVPGEIYTSREVFELEKDRIFLKSWNLICRAEEIASFGDYIALEVGGEPIVVARTKDGAIAASINACRHRGVEVAYGRGNQKRFVCPYHAWTYGVDGQLIGAQFLQSAGRDASDCSLKRLRTAEWRGWVFVNFDPAAPAFEDFIKPWEERLWFYQAGDCRLAFTVELEFRCNWKLLTENVSDFYHASTVHADSFGKQFDFKDGEVPTDLTPPGGWTAEFDNQLRKNFSPRFADLPWLTERQSFAAGKGAIWPNANVFANRESIRTSVFRPISVDRTAATWWFLLPEAAMATPGGAENVEYYRRQIIQIATEDQAVVESLQRGAGSRYYTPGPLIRMEAAIQHMIRDYLDVMGF